MGFEVIYRNDFDPFNAIVPPVAAMFVRWWRVLWGWCNSSVQERLNEH